jgi:hypothetical protein
MENKRFVLSVAGIFVATVAAGWIHGWGTLRYESWTAFAENVPCDMVETVGRDVNVTGTLIVDREPYEQDIISDEKLIKIIDDRCHLKDG